MREVVIRFVNETKMAERRVADSDSSGVDPSFTQFQHKLGKS